MENQSQIDLIRRTVEDLFRRIDFKLESLNLEKSEGPDGQEVFIVKIKSDDDCTLLLDDKGQNLKALEHLARLLAFKEANKKVGLVLDLNDFLEKRNNRILELARLVAEKVESSGKSFVLRPMSAYERRLIHLELAGRPKIKTESIGQEPKRKVIISPAL